MIRASELIDLFEQMHRERWSYEWGAARKGCVDCSGAFVYAYRQFGESIYHGSNSIARRYVGPMQKTPAPGFAAFKWKAKDTTKYPDGRGDYYHIGLVDAGGQYVLNAQGTKAGFTRTKASGWHCFAPLLAVEYGDPSAAAAASPRQAGATESEGGLQVIYQAIVTTSSGSLNMRSGPGTSYPVVFKLPKGTPVTVLIEYDSGWAFVDEDGTQGYVSLKYLTKVEPAATSSVTPDGVTPSPREASPAGEKGKADGGEDEIVMRYGVWVPCGNMDQAVALAATHPGAIFTAYAGSPLCGEGSPGHGPGSGTESPTNYKPPDD